MYNNRASAYSRASQYRRQQLKKYTLVAFVIGVVWGLAMPLMGHELGCSGALERQDVAYLKTHCVKE